VSDLWTPSGDDPASETSPEAPLGAPPPSAEEIAAMREVQARLQATPVEAVIANHAIGLLQLGLLQLGYSALPDDGSTKVAPNLAAAGLAIDAVAALVDGLGSRLGELEADLRDALVQAQQRFVEVADALGEDAG
jgi:hypothetical protein